MANSVKNYYTQRDDFEKFYRDHSPRIERELRVALGEITVFCGKNIMSNTRAACEKGLALVASGYFRKALVLNCSSNQRWALRIAREVGGETAISDKLDTPVCVMGMAQGMLSRELVSISECIRETAVDVILMNSWEFASCNPRYREELLFGLRRLMEETNVTVIIYSQAAVKEFTPGVIMRGTLGRLSALAMMIAPVENNGGESVAKTEITPISPDDHSAEFINPDGSYSGVRADESEEYILHEHRELALAA